MPPFLKQLRTNNCLFLSHCSNEKQTVVEADVKCKAAITHAFTLMCITCHIPSRNVIISHLISPDNVTLNYIVSIPSLHTPSGEPTQDHYHISSHSNPIWSLHQWNRSDEELVGPFKSNTFSSVWPSSCSQKP